MANLYQKIKSFLAGQNMFHILYIYLLANVIACLFKFGGAIDPLLYFIASPVLAWMVGVGIESFDGYYGTKQLDETGVPGNIFSTKDLLYDAIGAVLGIISVLVLVL